MRRLLSANLYAMISAKWFWAGTVIIAGASLYSANERRGAIARGWVENQMDESLFTFAPILFLLLPALAALFINTDYHDGTIRNKLTVGRSRAAVYMANLITVFATALYYMVLGMAATLLGGIGIPVEDPLAAMAEFFLLVLVFLSLTAIITLMATLITSRSGLVVSVMLAIVLVFCAQLINSSLESPELMDEYDSVVAIIQEDGSVRYQYLDKDGNPIDMKNIPQVPNPHYIQEPMRTVLRAFNNIQPGGQLVELLGGGHQEYVPESQAIEAVQTPGWQLALYSLGVTLAFTLAGILLFRQKDLK